MHIVLVEAQAVTFVVAEVTQVFLDAIHLLRHHYGDSR